MVTVKINEEKFLLLKTSNLADLSQVLIEMYPNSCFQVSWTDSEGPKEANIESLSEEKLLASMGKEINVQVSKSMEIVGNITLNIAKDETVTYSYNKAEDVDVILKDLRLRINQSLGIAPTENKGNTIDPIIQKESLSNLTDLLCELLPVDEGQKILTKIFLSSFLRGLSDKK